MIDLPVISVIIPCFNHGKYIRQTIESLVAQTLALSEIIIVDDGSTEEYTLSVLREIESNTTQVRVVRINNGGPGAARNAGFQQCKGNYILLIDSDDSIHETFVEKAIHILNRYPRFGAVSSWALCFGFEDYIWYPQGGTLKDFLRFTTCPSCALLSGRFPIPDHFISRRYDHQ